jgi:hypothetical protein
MWVRGEWGSAVSLFGTHYMKYLPYKFNSAEPCVYKGLKRTLLCQTHHSLFTTRSAKLRPLQLASYRKPNCPEVHVVRYSCKWSVRERIRQCHVNSLDFHKLNVFPKTGLRQTEIAALPDSWGTNAPSVKMVCQTSPVRIFSQNHNTLTCWFVIDWLGYFRLRYNCASVGYGKLLFHERKECLRTDRIFEPKLVGVYLRLTSCSGVLDSHSPPDSQESHSPSGSP